MMTNGEEFAVEPKNKMKCHREQKSPPSSKRSESMAMLSMKEEEFHVGASAMSVEDGKNICPRLLILPSTVWLLPPLVHWSYSHQGDQFWLTLPLISQPHLTQLFILSFMKTFLDSHTPQSTGLLLLIGDISLFFFCFSPSPLNTTIIPEFYHYSIPLIHTAELLTKLLQYLFSSYLCFQNCPSLTHFLSCSQRDHVNMEIRSCQVHPENPLSTFLYTHNRI